MIKSDRASLINTKFENVLPQMVKFNHPSEFARLADLY